MEVLASVVYRLIGREDVAWARSLAVAAWTLGGLAVFRLTVQLLSGPAAVAAVAVWAFVPFGITASQSFQPDPLMTSLIVLTLATVVSAERRRTPWRIVLFGVCLAATLAVKVVAGFLLGPALVAVTLLGTGSLRDKAVTSVVALLAALPAGWYYSTLPLATDYGPFLQLLREPAFWQGWSGIVHHVVSWPLLVAALAGAAVATGELRRLLVALSAGYIAFGIVFTHHIHTHDYYSLPLIPMVALGVGALVDRIGRMLSGTAPAAVAAAVSVGLLAWGGAAVAAAQSSGRHAAHIAKAAGYARIGAVVNHSPKVLSLDEEYGLALNYHGHVVSSHWPDSGDLAMLSLTGGQREPAEERLRASGADFFVCTSQAQMEAQPDLKAALEGRHPLLAREGEPDRWAFVVYDLRRGVLSATPANLSFFSHVGGPAAAAETVSLYAAPGARWIVQVPPEGVVSVTPSEGTGPATLRVTAAPLNAVVDRTVTITIHSPTDGSSSFEVRIRGVAGLNQPPFGFVDAPPDPITLGDTPIVLQGWALDDTSMKRVWVGYSGPAGEVISLGEARREGRRPDLAAAFPTAHDLFKAAWAFTLQPSAIRDVPRPIRLQFFAEDGSGHRTGIGTRTVQ